MLTGMQKIVSMVAAATTLVAFVVQPKIMGDNTPAGYHRFDTIWCEVGARSEAMVFPDYPMLAVEGVAILLVTGLLHLAGGRRE